MDAPLYAEVTTDKDGRYELGLQKLAKPVGFSGVIKLTNCIVARDFQRSLAGFQEFTGTPTNMDLELRPGITLSGMVKDTNGAPLTNAEADIRFRSSSAFALANNVTIEFGPRPVKVDAQGKFSIPALPQGGKFFFQGSISAPGYGVKWVGLNAEDVQTNHYEFSAFVLPKADRQLVGYAVDRDGRALAGVQVHCAGLGQRQDNSHAQTDNLGRFAFDNLCEGPVTIMATYLGPPDNRVNVGILKSSRADAQAGDKTVILKFDVTQPDDGAR
jgi:hypothetical protein